MKQIKYHRNSTLAIGEVGCQVGQVALIVSCLKGLVLMVYMNGVVKYIRYTSGFRLQVMLEVYLGVSGTCTLQIYRGT